MSTRISLGHLRPGLPDNFRNLNSCAPLVLYICRRRGWRDALRTRPPVSFTLRREREPESASSVPESRRRVLSRECKVGACPLASRGLVVTRVNRWFVWASRNRAPAFGGLRRPRLRVLNALRFLCAPPHPALMRSALLFSRNCPPPAGRPRSGLGPDAAYSARS